MATAKKRRFPYAAREESGRTYAELPNGRELILTGPAGAKATARARAQDAAGIKAPPPYAPVQPPGYDPTFDATAYNRAVEAAYAPLPMSARGSVRDLAPADDGAQGAPFSRATVPAREGTGDPAMAPAPTPAHVPTLAEAQETRRAIAGPLTGGDDGVDIIYREPAPVGAPRPTPAVKPKARLREGADVHFRDPEEPIDA